MMKKLFVLAGEVSGDMHAGGAVAELLKVKPDTAVFGIGGRCLAALGARLLYDTDRMSIMGMVDVLRHAGFLRRVIRELKEEILKERPSAALLVDYPGMNLHMAAFLHEQGIPVIFYIAPQVWAWKEGRVKTIRRFVDRLLVIFDFEVEFFQRHGIKAEFVGHPVIEELADLSFVSRSEFCARHDIAAGTRLIGLLPGSRKQEIRHIFPDMLEAARLLANDAPTALLFGRAPHLDRGLYGERSDDGTLTIIECSAYDVMHYSDLALVTSGTATFESLCFGVPMIVVYRTGWLNYQIGRKLVKLHNIALANIVSKGLYSKERTVPELLQHEASAVRIHQEARRILDTPGETARMRMELLAARARLAEATPSPRVAAVLQEYL